MNKSMLRLRHTSHGFDFPKYSGLDSNIASLSLTLK